MNKSQCIIDKYNEEVSSMNNLGPLPKGVISTKKKKSSSKNPLKVKTSDGKDLKKIKKTIKKYEKYIDSYPAEVIAKKRLMKADNMFVEEGTKAEVVITDIPSSNVFDITFIGENANGVFRYESKEEAEQFWTL